MAYVGETDETFLSAAQRRIFMERAYDEYVEYIIRHNPWPKTISVDIAMGNVTTYDLALVTNPVRILGVDANLTAQRLHKLIQLCIVDTATGRLIEVLRGATRLDSVAPVTSLGFQSGYNDSEAQYLFQGTNLLFNFSINRTIRAYYVPQNTTTQGGINWAADGVGVNTFVDDLYAFHDVISLLAFKQYQIMDNEVNQALEMQLRSRLDQFSAFLLSGRDSDGSSRVQAVV